MLTWGKASPLVCSDILPQPLSKARLGLEMAERGPRYLLPSLTPEFSPQDCRLEGESVTFCSLVVHGGTRATAQRCAVRSMNLRRNPPKPNNRQMEARTLEITVLFVLVFSNPVLVQTQL